MKKSCLLAAFFWYVYLYMNTVFRGISLYKGNVKYVIFYSLLSIAAGCIFLSFHPEYYSFADFYNQKRVLQLMVLAAVFLLMLTEVTVPRPFIAQDLRTNAGLYVFFGTGLGSAFLAEYWLHALHEWLGFLLWWFFVVSVVVIFERHKGIAKCTVAVLMLSAGLYLVKFLMVLLWSLSDGLPVYAEALVSGVVNENFIAQPLGMIAPFFAVWGVSDKARFAWLGRLLFFTSVLFMLVIYCRSVILSLFIVFSIWALFSRTKKSRSLLKLYLVCLLLALISFLLMDYFVGVFGIDRQIGSVLSSANRDVLWYAALLAGLENPFFGVGPYGYTFITPFAGTSHPHNIYMQIIAEWGFIAVFALGFTFLCLARKTIKVVTQANCSLMLLAAFLGLFEGFLHVGLSGVLVMPLSQLMFFILLGLVVSGCGRAYAADMCLTSLPLDKAVRVSIFFSIAVLLVFITFVFIGYYLSEWREGSCVINNGPRYWVDGGVHSCSE